MTNCYFITIFKEYLLNFFSTGTWKMYNRRFDSQRQNQAWADTPHWQKVRGWLWQQEAVCLSHGGKLAYKSVNFWHLFWMKMDKKLSCSGQPDPHSVWSAPSMANLDTHQLQIYMLVRSHVGRHTASHFRWYIWRLWATNYNCLYILS